MEIMGPTVKTSRTIDVDKVQLMSESESRMHKPFKLRKTFGKYRNVLCFVCGIIELHLNWILFTFNFIELNICFLAERQAEAHGIRVKFPAKIPVSA